MTTRRESLDAGATLGPGAVLAGCGGVAGGGSDRVKRTQAGVKLFEKKFPKGADTRAVEIHRETIDVSDFDLPGEATGEIAEAAAARAFMTDAAKALAS